MKIRFSKVRDVKDPVRGTKGSVGYDFFIPKFTQDELVNKGLDKFIVDGILTLPPNQGILIPAGIHVNLEDIKSNIPDSSLDNWVVELLVDNKSGIATKKNVIVGANTIDEDYQGEIHIHVINVGTEAQEFKLDEKIVQMKFHFCLTPDWEEVDIDNLFETVSDRGNGGFGSTGLK